MNKDVPDDKHSKDKKYACENNDSLVTYCNNSSENFPTKPKSSQSFVCNQVDLKVYSCPIFQSKDS